jgi:hypothetical protein
MRSRLRPLAVINSAFHFRHTVMLVDIATPNPFDIVSHGCGHVIGAQRHAASEPIGNAGALGVPDKEESLNRTY